MAYFSSALLLTEIAKVISQEKNLKKKKLETFHPLPTIPCEDQNDNSYSLREELFFWHSN